MWHSSLLCKWYWFPCISDWSLKQLFFFPEFTRQSKSSKINCLAADMLMFTCSFCSPVESGKLILKLIWRGYLGTELQCYDDMTAFFSFLLGAWAMRHMGYAVLCNAQPHINSHRNNVSYDSSSLHSHLRKTNETPQNLPSFALLTIPIFIPYPLEYSFIVHLWNKVFQQKITAGTFSVHQSMKPSVCLLKNIKALLWTLL